MPSGVILSDFRFGLGTKDCLHFTSDPSSLAASGVFFWSKLVDFGHKRLFTLWASGLLYAVNVVLLFFYYFFTMFLLFFYSFP